MLILTLDGIKIKWKPEGLSAHDHRSKSSYHNTAKEFLLAKYPNYVILEEVSAPVLKGKTLFLDLYIPIKKLVIEVHGEQHFKFIPHFHVTKAGFIKQQHNDALKEEWCVSNNINYMVLSCKNENKWQTIIDAL